MDYIQDGISAITASAVTAGALMFGTKLVSGENIMEDKILKTMVDGVEVYMHYEAKEILYYEGNLDKKHVKTHTFQKQTLNEDGSIKETASYYLCSQKQNKIIEVFITLIKYSNRDKAIIVVTPIGGATFTAKFNDGTELDCSRGKSAVRYFDIKNMSWV